MKHSKKYFAVTILLLCSLFATGQSYDSLVAKVQLSFAKIESQKKLKSKNSISAFRHCSQQFQELALNITNSRLTLSSEYITQIASFITLLEIIAQTSDSNLQTKIILDLHEDLKLKNVPISPYPQAKSWLISSISVLLNVFVNNEHSKNVDVKYVPFLWSSSKTYERYLNSNTSPYIFKIPPGRYIFQFISDGKIIKEKQMIFIDSQNRNHITINISL